MDAFLSWLHSSETATPLQAAAIVVTFVTTTCFNLWLACRFSAGGDADESEAQ